MSQGIDADAAVYDRIRELRETDEPAVVATVVDVHGRAYRRPGARLVATPAGMVGAVTPGCLEDELRALTRSVLDAGEPRLERYDLTADDDVWGLGVGCEGVVDVLVEPLDAAIDPVLGARSGSAAHLAAVLESTIPDLEIGDRARVDSNRWSDDVRQSLDAAMDDVPTVVDVSLDQGTVSVFLERVEPPVHLLVIGTDATVAALVSRATGLDVDVTVASFRGPSATHPGIPQSTDVHTTSPRSLTDTLPVDDRTYVVLATHNLVDDRLALEALLDSEAPYVGVLGPTDRYREIRDAIESERGPLTADERERIYAPVGLDIGGGDPVEIAHSVLAEVLAVANDRSGGHLRERDEPIHPRSRRD